jgi:hypothetical protein
MENDIKPALVDGVSVDQVFKWCTLRSLVFFLFSIAFHIHSGDTLC